MKNARLLSIAILTSAVVLARYPETKLPVGEPQKRLAGFPEELNGWKGQDQPFSAEVMKVANTDDDLHRMYENAGKRLWLYVGYYGTKKGGRTGHLPHHCYPGSGFRIVDLGKEDLSLSNGQTVRVNRILTERAGKLTLALYWIQSGDQKVLSDGWQMNITRLRRRLTTGRDDGALVRISANVDGPVDAALETQKKFAADVLDKISEHWPLEVGAPQTAPLAQARISVQTEWS